MCTLNCILVQHSNLIRTMVPLFCAVNVFLVFVELKVKVHHRKQKDRNNVKLDFSGENYLLITLLIQVNLLTYYIVQSPVEAKLVCS